MPQVKTKIMKCFDSSMMYHLCSYVPKLNNMIKQVNHELFFLCVHASICCVIILLPKVKIKFILVM